MKPFDWAKEDEFCPALLTGIADELGRSPELLPPLTESIDPDTIESFVNSRSNANGNQQMLSFSYAGHEIRVTSTGTVVLTPLTHQTATGES